MKYLVIGAGGTGGPTGAYLARAGKDVTFIARGAHLKKIQNEGLKIVYENDLEKDFTAYPKAADMDHYAALIEKEKEESPDVIIVCVKGYSLDDTIPFIRKVSKENTIVIPVLNIYGTGERMQERLPEILVTDGCIYIAAEIKEPGTILMKGDILKIPFGTPEKSGREKELSVIADDMGSAGIDAVLSENIRLDCMKKFSYISPNCACGLYYDTDVEKIQQKGEIQNCFLTLIREITKLADAMGIHFDEDMAEKNLSIMKTLSPRASTSMQRDVWSGKQSEIDGLIFQVPRLAEKYGVSLPEYEKITKELHERGF